MKIIDLFAGIGVASLAAETVWPGIEHEFVEINPFSQTILKKHFPNSPIHDDIRTFHPTGTVDIVWGSPPCQAASQAGKRKGTADDRWLWPEYFRVIGEAKPRWVIAENVYGLLSLNGGLDFEELCLGMEALGYSIRTYIIPALAVGAPHRRDRVWIIGYRNADSDRLTRKEEINTTETREPPLDNVEGRYSEFRDTVGRKIDEIEVRKSRTEQDRKLEGGLERPDSATSDTELKRPVQCKSQERPRPEERVFEGSDSHTSNTNNRRPEECEQQTTGNQQCSGDGSDERWDWNQNWAEVATRVCRVADGTPKGLYRLDNGKTITTVGLRVERLKALGNSLVYPLVVKLFEAIKYADPRP